MALVRWDPVGELASTEVDRLHRMFSSFYSEGLSRSWVPPVDIYETEQHEIVLEAELPGMKREDIDITFDNNVLTLKGERKIEHEIARDRFQRMERFEGSFSRSFTLPPTIDAANISASYKDGVLTVRLPQREESKPKQIAVGD
jgi:HSP20 family protein